VEGAHPCRPEKLPLPENRCLSGTIHLNHEIHMRRTPQRKKMEDSRWKMAEPASAQPHTGERPLQHPITKGETIDLIDLRTFAW